ncbi:sugar ABC transporter substrate-binding protein [Solwaraspora sp. WMMB335]|uniref:sugar ABC transporter substrate-binding protein n=1 Tax=Solwaraspora sp. WMMB335 TaxID=3404118 RepID=UPI003B945CD8
MDGIRRRRRAIAHDLTVSLAAAAIVAAATKLLSMIAPGLLTWPVPRWLVAAALPGTAAAFFLLGRRLNRHPPQAFVVISVPTWSRWIADLVRQLADTLGSNNIDLVLKYVPYDYSGRNQLRKLDSLRKTRSHTVGGFIIAAQPQHVLPELVEFCTSTEYPIVFLDVLPFADRRDYPARSAFVGCDARKIGEQAAEWVARDLRRQAVVDPHVLVMTGDAQHGRHERFTEVLWRLIPAVTIDVIESGQFTRDRAYESATSYLRTRRRHGAAVHAVFCTNDEMALGVLDAVQARIAAGDDLTELAVIGVDGIAEVRALINADNTQLRATIVQDANRIAQTGVDILLRMRGGAPSPGPVLIPTELYPAG